MSQLTKFLANYVAEADYTNIDMSGRQKKVNGILRLPNYLIPEGNYPDFLEKYYNELECTAEYDQKLYLCELRAPFFRFYVDFDMKEPDFPLLPEYFYINILQMFETTIKSIFVDVPNLTQHIVSKREDWKIHINYPNLILDTTTALEIRQLVLQKIQATYDIPLKWEKIVDSAVYTHSGLRMIGSYKFNHNPKPGEPKEIPPYQIVDQIHPDNTMTIKEPLTLEDIKLTSIRPLPTRSETSKKIKQIKTKTKKPQEKPTAVVVKDPIILETLEKVRMETKNHPVFSQYQLELNGSCKRLEGPKGPIYYIPVNDHQCQNKGDCHSRSSDPLFLEVAKNSVSLKCHAIACHGKCYPDPPLAINAQYAQILNIVINNYNNTEPENVTCDLGIDVKIYDNQQANDALCHSLKGTHQSVAQAFFEIYKDKFRFDQNVWFYYDRHRWRVDKSGHYFEVFFHQNMPQCYRQLHEYYLARTKDNADERAKKAKIFTKIINDIENTSFKESVIRPLKSNFNQYCVDFLDILDTNKRLVGFVNGVFDLDSNQFRDGLPSDNISMSTGYEYQEVDDRVYKTLWKFLSSIMPYKVDLFYLLKSIAYALRGEADLDIMHIFSGIGRNGKSLLRKLIEATFGEYYTTAPSSLFTESQPDSSKPQPIVIRLQKKRIVVASEPEAQKKINTGFLKQLTGKDEVLTRKLFSNEIISVVPDFHIIILCNDLPALDQNSQAAWDRIRTIIFPVKFVARPNPNNPLEKQIDVRLSHKINEWKLAFFKLLCLFYKKYQQEGLTATPKIVTATKVHRCDSDVYGEYLEERIVESETHLHIATLYQDFVLWYERKFPTEQVPNSNKFRNGIKNFKTIEKVKIEGETARGIKGIALADNRIIDDEEATGGDIEESLFTEILNELKDTKKERVRIIKRV